MTDPRHPEDHSTTGLGRTDGSHRPLIHLDRGHELGQQNGVQDDLPNVVDSLPYQAPVQEEVELAAVVDGRVRLPLRVRMETELGRPSQEPPYLEPQHFTQQLRQAVIPQALDLPIRSVK